MKTYLQNFFISITQFNHLRKCENSSGRTFMLSALCALSVWRSWPGVVRKKLWSLKQSAHQVVLTGQSVSRISLLRLLLNKRVLVGIVLLVVGAFGVFAHQFLSDPYIENHAVCPFLGFQPGQCYDRVTDSGWCYMSWFYYLEEVSLYVAIIFWSLAGFVLVPLRFGGVSSIAFSLFNAFGWTMFIHRSFFTASHETYHAVPHWSVFVLALSFGFGLVLSAKNVINWYNHKLTGSQCRHVGVTEMDLTPEEKEPIYKSLRNEFRQIQRMI